MSGIQITLRAKNLNIYYDSYRALSIPSLEVQGNVIAIIGHNGSGKSTLIKAILGLLAPRSGSVETCAAPNSVFGTEEILVPENHMAFSPENGSVFADIDVESYLQLWCRIKHRDAHYYKSGGREIIERLDLKPLFKKLGRELSKGQRRKVQTAAGLLCHPKLFLFDEPFDGLDIVQSTVLSQIMVEQSEKMGMIITSHRMDVVEQLADQVIVLRNGGAFISGPVAHVCAQLYPQAPARVSLAQAMNHHLLNLHHQNGNGTKHYLQPICANTAPQK